MDVVKCIYEFKPHSFSADLARAGESGGVIFTPIIKQRVALLMRPVTLSNPSSRFLLLF
jgi:hypothetical protein